MIRYFPLLTALALLASAQPAAACDPPAMQRQAAPSYQGVPPGYMLVPIAPRQYAPPPMMFAQASYGGQAMIVSAPRGGYAMASARGAYSTGGVAVSVTHQRAILPRNRGVSVGVAGGGMGAAVSVRTGRAAIGSRASGGCAT